MTPRMQKIADQLTGDRRRLLEAIADLGDVQYRFRASEGHWAIADILEHLALSHEAMMIMIGRLAKEAQAKGLTCIDDDSVPEWPQRDLFAVPANKREAPKMVVPSGSMAVAEALSRLEASRAHLLELLREFGRYDLAAVSATHPLGPELNGYQWILLTGAHEARHSLQIQCLRAHASFPS